MSLYAGFQAAGSLGRMLLGVGPIFFSVQGKLSAHCYCFLHSCLILSTWLTTTLEMYL